MKLSELKQLIACMENERDIDDDSDVLIEVGTQRVDVTAAYPDFNNGLIIDADYIPQPGTARSNCRVCHGTGRTGCDTCGSRDNCDNCYPD